MSTLDPVNAAHAEGTPVEQDLGPLAWVLDELRKSLDGAVKALRRFVHEADLARESDLATLDVASLRMARQQLHQAGGALEMVGMASPALVLRSMETAVQRFVQRPELCTDDAAGAIERACFALSEYLESVLAGKAVSPVALFPQYRDVQALRQTSGLSNGAFASLIPPCPWSLWPMVRQHVRGWTRQYCALSRMEISTPRANCAMSLWALPLHRAIARYGHSGRFVPASSRPSAAG